MSKPPVSGHAALRALGVVVRGDRVGSKARPFCRNGCGEHVEITYDAIGRERERCPSCDGVAPRVLTPHVTRVQGNHPELQPPPPPAPQALPAIEEGQLRCQGCGRGVDGEERFCARCQRGRGLKQFHIPECRKCHRSFMASGPNTRTCPECR